MNQKKNIEIQNLFQDILKNHQHAFLISTQNREVFFENLKIEIDEFFKENKNENFFLNLKVFDIEKSRNLIDFCKINFSNLHFLLISFYSINLSAQNALLKILEETPKNLKIIFITEKKINLLPTILSRMYKIEIDLADKNSSQDDEEIFLKNLVDKFLKAEKLKRMNLPEIKEILNKKDIYALENEDKDRKDREVIEKFLFLLYENILDKYQKEKYSKNLLEISKEILEFLKYINLPSSSPKIILEYLSLKI